VRIETLPQTNHQIQGPARRTWLLEHAPLHLQECKYVSSRALSLRLPETSRSTLVMGAGACTEVPLADLARHSQEVVLADIDLVAMQHARDELESRVAQRRIRFVQCDLTAGVSTNLNGLLRRLDWRKLRISGARVLFDAVAECLEQCVVPDPPEIYTLRPADFGVIVSSLVVSQLYSNPLLDVMDMVQGVTPALVGEQERHRRYQEAAQAFRSRIIAAHLHHIRSLLDIGGVCVLISDVRGFVFNVMGTEHDNVHRRYLPVVPRTFPDLISDTFTVFEERQWDFISDLPTNDRPGRGYEVSGYILQLNDGTTASV
jgi:hypothetical protein